MTRLTLLLVLACLALPGGVQAVERPPSAAEVVGSLRNDAEAGTAWAAVLAQGDKAVPELKKLLGDPSDLVRARAAVLLHRLGDASALDALAALLSSKDEAARRQAASALLAFVGEPMDFDASAPETEREKAAARWKAWWERNRKAAMAQPPMSVLYGRIVRTDLTSDLVVVSLTAMEGAKAGMRLSVARATAPVCVLRVVAPAAGGSVAQIVPLSLQQPPQAGDTFFSVKD